LISCLIFTSSFSQLNHEVVSHYLFPEFTKGSILMNDGMEYDLLLNYNSLTEEMIFENDGQRLAISKNDVGNIDTVYIQDRKFIPWNSYFVELLFNSKWDLFAEYKCELKEVGKPIGYGSRSRTTAITSYSSIAGDISFYDLKIPENFEIDPGIKYWIKKNGEIYGFSKLSDFKKVYKSKKDLFKAYIKENKTKFEDQEGIIQLIEYMESNQVLQGL